MRIASIAELDNASAKEIEQLSNFMAGQVGSMSAHDVAHGAYATSNLPPKAGQIAKRLTDALLLRYRADLIEWMEHALMKRARVGGGGPVIKKIEKGLAQMVESIPDIIRGRAPDTADSYLPVSGYLDPSMTDRAIRTIVKTVRRDAEAAGVLGGSNRLALKQFPLDLQWNERRNRWDIPSNPNTYGHKDRLRRIGFRWDPSNLQWYLPRFDRNDLPQRIRRYFPNLAAPAPAPARTPAPVPSRGASGLHDWYFGTWLPANIDRFTKVFTDVVRNKQTSYKMLFSVAGDKVSVKFKRKVDNARDAIEELRYRYIGRQGREPWLETMDRFVDLVGATSPNKVRTLIDRINNLQHSNGLFMEHFPSNVRSWYDGFLNAKYNVPTGSHLARYIDDRDLRDLITHLDSFGVDRERSPRIQDRNLRYEPPGNYHLIEKELEDSANAINWRKRGYPKFRGYVQVDRFSPQVQKNLGILAELAADRERLLNLRITTPEAYTRWVAEAKAIEEQQARAVSDLKRDLETQHRRESQRDPNWWLNRSGPDAENWMRINFPEEFVERFPYAVPGVGSEIGRFVARYASARRVAMRYERRR
jgi:hypothetical protein